MVLTSKMLVAGAEKPSGVVAEEPLPPRISLIRTFPLSVNFEMTLGDAIASGRFSECSQAISTGKFPLFDSHEKAPGSVDLEAGVFDVGNLDTRTAICEVEKFEPHPPVAWKIARLGHLLVFGRRYPEEQLTRKIVALRSRAEINGAPYVPILHKASSGARRLGVVIMDFEWDGAWILAVRPVCSSG